MDWDGEQSCWPPVRHRCVPRARVAAQLLVRPEFFGEALVSLNPLNIAKGLKDLLATQQSPVDFGSDVMRAATAAREGRFGDAGRRRSMPPCRSER